MKEITIRNLKSDKKVKPRIFDAVVEDDQRIKFVVKNNHGTQEIYLDEVMSQIKKAEGK